MASPSGSVPDTSLGLTQDEIQILRRAQMEAGGAAGSTSSRAASRASSQGLLLLNPNSLQSLVQYFDNIMARIEARLEGLQAQVEQASEVSYGDSEMAMQIAYQEEQRLHAAMAMMDELDAEWDRMGKLKNIVSLYRARVEQMERDLAKSGSSRRDGKDRKDGKKHHGSGHGHSSSSKSHHKR